MGEKKVKLTKKMFESIDHAELRNVARLGMGMADVPSYTMKYGDLIWWVIERADKLATVDLEECKPRTFRPKIREYLTAIQGYIAGEGPAPSWPMLDVVGGGAEEEPAVEKAPVKAEKTKTKRKAKKKAPKEKQPQLDISPRVVPSDLFPMERSADDILLSLLESNNKLCSQVDALQTSLEETVHNGIVTALKAALSGFSGEK